MVTLIVTGVPFAVPSLGVIVQAIVWPALAVERGSMSERPAEITLRTTEPFTFHWYWKRTMSPSRSSSTSGPFMRTVSGSSACGAAGSKLAVKAAGGRLNVGSKVGFTVTGSVTRVISLKRISTLHVPAMVCMSGMSKDHQNHA